MRLLQRTAIYFMGFSLLILLLGGIGIFYSLQYMLDHELDESLYHTRTVLNKELSRMDQLPPVVEIMDEIIDIREVATSSAHEMYRDTFRMIDEIEDGELTSELEPFRQYIYTDEINGKYYRIALNHSKFDKEHLLTVITTMVIGFFIFFFLALNFFNRVLSQKLWQPFYNTINQVRSFNFSQSESLKPKPTAIEEFNTLNEALQQMTDKLISDYQSLKRFTENASHETQTPLAIINTQIDLLLQREQSEDNLKYIQQIQKSSSKLSKLNKSLLLLTRIENRQFEAKEMLQFDEIIKQKLEAMEILFEGKSLSVHKELIPVKLEASPILLDVIISNLLSNAIRHNIQNGTIKITLNKKQLIVKNMGLPNQKKASELFERFRKSDDAGKSLGLGLAIVREVCNLYSWGINYENKEQWHELTIEFSKSVK